MLYKSVVNLDWQAHLDRWLGAGIVNEEIAGRIRTWESEQPSAQGLRWPILIALAFGALLLCAGVLLFVSAHWDELSPGQRMGTVVFMVAIFHAAGAWADPRFEALSVSLHTIGTFALGAGIALTGQIFNLSAHWPNAILLWAVGSTSAWLLLRHWTQAAITAVLVPVWIAGEMWPHSERSVAVGICALAITYLSARRDPEDGWFRNALGWIGAIALYPSVFMISTEDFVLPSAIPQFVGWAAALLVPMTVAVFLRGRDAVWNAGAVGWVVALSLFVPQRHHSIFTYLWCAVGATGLVMWGVRESRPERINLGMAGFAITVLAFYFSDVMDKLDRSFSLILLGLLFLGGGWILERMRRGFIAQIHHPEAA